MSEIEHQQKIKATAFHPTGSYIEMSIEELNQSIVQRFEAQVRRNGNRPAIKIDQRELSYDELNNVANCLAFEVRKHTSTGPVVVLVELGEMAIACMLGVLKAGLAYAHVDPMVPQASGAARMSELGSTLVLSDAASLELRASAGPLGCPVLHIDDLDFGIVRTTTGVSLDADSSI